MKLEKKKRSRASKMYLVNNYVSPKEYGDYTEFMLSEIEDYMEKDNPNHIKEYKVNK